ncbi:MAG: flagellar hook-basal body complex protein [Hyphomonas sp.]|jgi:flagellar basal-body rod protein FlgF|uniref:flagellar hook-basal body complex protein n=1 Tax=Hyphomonas sp. TaxID=87 RepID=UPI0037BF8403|nr:flagellar hook-basal body complex protein [Hyphomonas sp.]
MSTAIYTSLGRQQGLMQEMQVVSNNIANSNTTGYKTDRAIFAEFLVSPGQSQDSVSMGGLGGHAFRMAQGEMRITGGQFDLAVQGEGFFVLQTDQGPRLSRAGHFQLSSESTLIDAFGNSVLGAGGNPITIPPDASQVAIGTDGSISANGQLVDRVGVVTPQGQLLRDTNTFFSAPEGYAPFEEAIVVQGALEGSNVSPILEVARMIEVQRAYEAGQAMMEREDDRISQLITSLRER